ncbi:MAG: hypothetical protein SNJ79_10065, partial [Sphingomonadaceae bacterium]
MAGEDDVEWWEHEDASAMAQELAGDLAFLTAQAIEGHGTASLALPSDLRVEPVLEALAGESLDWSKVTIVPTDTAEDEETSFRELFGSRGATILALDPDLQLPLPLDIVWLSIDDAGTVAGI